MNDGKVIEKILVLAANPRGTARLRLDEEVREIDNALRIAKNRKQFVLKQKWAVRSRDLRLALAEFEPTIVHFSGNSTGEGSLVLENKTGDAHLVSAEALAQLFSLYPGVKCVVLNACYSEIQAKVIAQYVPCVIGMSQKVGDQAALEFAIGFYDALGSGSSIKRSFKLGCVSILMAGIEEHLTPVLLQQESVKDSEKTDNQGFFVPDNSSPADPVLLDEPEGQVPLDSNLYIDRPPIEERCYETITKRGALIRIKAPRQMGKSSLMLRILNHGIQQGYRGVSLNLQAAGEKALSSVEQFLYWFCARITRKLNLPNKLEEYWQGSMGGNDKCTDYFEYHLLEELTSPLVLCLDEVDELFMHQEIASDFFGLLRAWHEDAKINPIWQNLRIVITHSKEVYIPLNINQSPFNVGVPIDLPPLTQEQVMSLVQRHGLCWSVAETEPLMELMGGHPYLVRVALYNIARGDLTLAQLLEIGPTEEWAYGEHLRRHFYNLQQDKSLRRAMQQLIVAGDKPVSLDVQAAFKLASLGLVRFKGNDVVPLCDLYLRYFKDRLEGS